MQTRSAADHTKEARLKVSDLRALLLESGQHAGGSGDFVQQVAAKYGIDTHVLHNVLKYNQLPSRGGNESEDDRLGFRSGETST